MLQYPEWGMNHEQNKDLCQHAACIHVEGDKQNN